MSLVRHSENERLSSELAVMDSPTGAGIKNFEFDVLEISFVHAELMRCGGRDIENATRLYRTTIIDAEHNAFVIAHIDDSYLVPKGNVLWAAVIAEG